VENVKAKKEHSKMKQEQYYNQGSQELAELQPGDTVRIKPHAHSENHKEWERAKVISKHDIRSYIVRTSDGREYRRNRRHLRHTSEQYDEQTVVLPEIEITGQEATDNEKPKQTLRCSNRARRQPQYLKDYVVK
jgi:hypothetical protein